MQLIIKELSKVYTNGVRALDNLSLEIGPGMFGLLGPNGAGKSTLMRTIATLQQPDQGHISFGDINVLQQPMQLRRILGYLPQDFGVYPKVSAQRLLEYFARLKGIASRSDRRAVIDEVLEITNLQAVRHQYVSDYSGGMKQRFGIAQLLLNDPRLIIVDEPTAGLDPAERRRFLNILREIGTHNTVIFSTHIVEDIKELCHEVAILSGGKLRWQGSPKEGTGQLRGKIWTTAIPPALLSDYQTQYQILSSHHQANDQLQIRVYASDRPGTEFLPADPQLEDTYFQVIQQAEYTLTTA